MVDSPVHDRYAAALTALADREAVLRALGLADGERPWRRTFGRFSPDAAAFVTLVYERAGDPPEIVVVEAYARRPKSGDPVALPEADGTAWLVTSGVIDDRRLTTLGEVLAGPGRRTVVRYRPGRRCTIRVEADGGTRYAKVQPSADVAALHRDAVALWQAARDGRLGFAVAPPDRFDAALHTLWQHAIDGEPLKPRLLSTSGAALGEPLGQALATLTTSGLQPAAAPDAWTPLARARSAGGDLARRVPALEPAVADVLRRIEALDRAAGSRPARPIHGAPHPGQWLDASGGRLGLVDFDRFALGDPELDVAVLLAEIEDESHAPAGLDHAVVDGYEAAAGRLDRRLLVAYRAAGRLATARRYARAVRPDGPQRAGRALTAAVAVLDDAGA